MSSAYRYVEGWGDEEGWPTDVTGVAVDGRDRVYVLRRDYPQVTVLDPEGRVMDRWGSDRISQRPHLISISGERAVIADDGGHRVFIFRLDGMLLETLGEGTPSETGYDSSGAVSSEDALGGMGGGPPFNRPTKGVLHGNDLFASDGYRNCRIHRFSAGRELVRSWGGSGSEPGCFVVPHSLAIDGSGRVLICDRENDRVQISSINGEVLDIWCNVQRPTDLAIDANGYIYLTELPRGPGDLKSWRLGRAEIYFPGRVTKRRMNGDVVAEILCEGVDFLAPHAVAVDSVGAVYVSEVPQSFGNYNGTTLRLGACLRKFEPQSVSVGNGFD